MEDPESSVTRFGFEWGNATIERLCYQKRVGRFMAILTDRESMEIRITPDGKISVYSHDKNKGVTK